MATNVQHLRSAVWFAVILQAVVVRALFWTVTSNYELSLSVETWTYRTSLDFLTYTSTRTISPGVTPTSAAISTSTYDRTFDDLEEVMVYFPPNAVQDSDLLPDIYATITTDSTSSAYTGTVFLMPVTYTAPSTCSSQFTWSTDEVVYIPIEVVDQIHPTSIVTDPPHTYVSYTGDAYETWYLSAGAAPITTQSEYYYTEYIEQCEKPYSSSGGGDDITVCYLYSGCTSLKTWVIIIASILPSLFVLGFLESWFWFRRLMTGRGCLRFGTVCWVMISLWIACFTRTQSARSKEDQKLLREQWKAMKGSTAFTLWWKWGFRHRYPEEILGKYDRNTIGIVRPNQPLTGEAQYAGPNPYNGQPPPPPGYGNQSGVPMMQPYPVYFEPGKEGAQVSEIPAAPPGQVWYTAAPTQQMNAAAVPIPAPYNQTRSPLPNNASEAPSSQISEAPSPLVSEVSATPYTGYAQPYTTTSPPPPHQFAGTPPSLVASAPSGQELQAPHQQAGPSPVASEQQHEVSPSVPPVQPSQTPSTNVVGPPPAHGSEGHPFPPSNKS